MDRFTFPIVNNKNTNEVQYKGKHFYTTYGQQIQEAISLQLKDVRKFLMPKLDQHTTIIKFQFEVPYPSS